MHLQGSSKNLESYIYCFFISLIFKLTAKITDQVPLLEKCDGANKQEWEGIQTDFFNHI